jgi:signal transduction histidine kinase
MSHDLRSPLNSILGFSELLLRGIEGPITDSQRKGLELIQDRGNQLLRLLNEILDTAKAESGRMELHRQHAPPAELVRAALQEARRGRRTAEEQVQIELRPGLQLIHADPLRVQQVLTNLVRNAQRHGAEPVTVSAALTSATEVRISVADEGAGVPAEFVPHLFDRYSRSRTTSAHGAGLGLSVVQDLVRAHGGEVSYDGATRAFVFTLPAISAPATADSRVDEPSLTAFV